MTTNKEIRSFTEGTPNQIVLRNIIPAVAAMIMVLIYNLADTFFIGQTHNDLMVAAVSLATPLFLIYMAIGSLFGMGGTSVISRALGEKRKEYARKVCSFCMWAGVITGAVCMALIWFNMDRILVLLGASEETMAYTRTYLSIVNLCGIFSIISNCYTNVVRAEGHSTAAMAGTLIGNLLSVILDPIMILMLGWGIAGAAIATVIGNAVAAVYYIVYYLKGSSELSISLKDFSVKDHIASSVLAIGIPASLTSILMSISQMITNSRMAAYGDMAVAGYGVSSKVLMIVTLAGIGVGQGIQPVLGYFYGSHDEKRFKACLKSGLLAGIILTGSLCILCWLFTGQLVQLFLSDQAAYSYGFAFTRIMLTTSWLFGIFYVLMNGLQAVGAAGPSLAVAVCRQGLIYIPCVFLFEKLIGVNGLAWAQPAADVLSLLLAAVLFHRTVRTIESERKTAPEEA